MVWGRLLPRSEKSGKLLLGMLIGALLCPAALAGQDPDLPLLPDHIDGKPMVVFENPAGSSPVRSSEDKEKSPSPPSPAPKSEPPKNQPQGEWLSGEQPVRAAPPRVRTVTVPANTVVNVQLTETLSTEKSNQGDKVVARLMEPLYIGPFLVAPEASTLIGTVSELNREAEENGPNPYIIVDFYELQRPDETNKLPFQATLIAYRTGLVQEDYVWRLPQERRKVRTRVADALQGAALGFSIDPIFGPPIGAGVNLLKSFLIDKIAERGDVEIKKEEAFPVAVQSPFVLPVIEEEDAEPAGEGEDLTMLRPVADDTGAD